MGELSIEAVERMDSQSVSDRIKNLLIDYLMTGRLKAGDRLPTELEFAAQLGVGRNSIREAIKMLSSLGIIDIRRGEGTFISETITDSTLNPLIIQLAMSQKSPQELIELRIFFDTAVAELVLEKMEDEDLQALVRINDQLKALVESVDPDVGGLCDLDMRFHVELINMTHNSLIQKIGETVYALFFSSIRDSINFNEHKGYGYQNHNKIIDALRLRDSVKVREAVADSLRHWRKRLEQIR